jgi:hypothetical protein
VLGAVPSVLLECAIVPEQSHYLRLANINERFVFSGEAGTTGCAKFWLGVGF